MPRSKNSSTGILEVVNASKNFGAVRALDGVDFALREREILALLGDNGAGKSTLVKVLSGIHTLDEGEVLIDSKRCRFHSSVDARAHGIETVYQDLALFDNLSPIANFYAGRELKKPSWLGCLGLLSEKRMKQNWAELADQLKVNIPEPSEPLALMSGGQRQAVAVARAVAFASRFVILDEPTAALGVRESGQVLELISRLPSAGVSVILISHNLEHVMQVADRAVVLRQGKKIGEVEATPENRTQMVSMIVG
ncbi:MAG TPA: ATP-binding cassette domain-containing protein [Solirubrobacterales bacterium]|nr:ATP-binding cassette domain-containing protein [Solirubrobacterales bacterium]